MTTESILMNLNNVRVFKRLANPLFNKCIQIPLMLKNRKYADDGSCPNLLRGVDYLRNPGLNKGLAFTMEERQALGIHGLLAGTVKTQKEQLDICTYSINRFKNSLNQHLYLTELLDTNEKLFYDLLASDIEKYLPLVYTPTVGLACQRFGLVYRRPKGLFITIHDKGKIYKILRNWPVANVRAICVTDGERILGLGDLGAYGMGIPIGKLCLYTALAGVPPGLCLPITLDCGTNNQMLLEDPLYIGLREKRVRGQEFDDFIQEFMDACCERFTHNVLIQFEDFALVNAIRLLEKYKNSYCTFNDDVQGTAGVIVAGIYSAARITKKKLQEQTFLFLGAGSAGVGIANLICDAMVEDGLTMEEAVKRIYLFDIDGLLSTKREGGVPSHATKFGKDMEPSKDFAGFVKSIKATTLIGASTVGGAFTPEILQQMAKNCERPQIYALSNPTVKAECTAQQAYDHTEGRCIFASGSPFPPVKYKGKTYVTGQGNNSYVFPGCALGVLACFAHHVPDSMFLAAARECANNVTDQDLELGRIYPSLTDIPCLSIKIAIKVIENAYNNNLAGIYPKPKDLNKFVLNYIYKTEYDSYLPDMYPYPEPSGIRVKSIKEAMAQLFKKRTSNAYFTRWPSLKKPKQPPNAHFSRTVSKSAVSGDVVVSNITKGSELLRNPRLNKGLAFTSTERQALGIHGLLSSEFRTLEQQMAICRLSVDRYRNALNKYIYLSELQDTNETLFFSLLKQDLQKYLPFIDSPTVGMACQKFGLIYNRCKGLFVTIHDRGHVIDVLKNWPERNVRAVVVTDGERVLGHGDLGAHGMGISHGKATLLTALAGIKPQLCLPVCLDSGTNNKALLDDPLYIGIRENRYPRHCYDELLGEFMCAVKKLFGPHTLVMMEDFATNNAHRILNMFRDECCLFNDDTQATAAVVVGGLMAACRNITKQKLRDQTYLFVGAGATGVGIANLLCDAMVEEGATWAYARNKCYMFDINGLLALQPELIIPPHVRTYVRDLDPEPNLIKCIEKFKATCLIGTTATRGVFTPNVLKEVAKNTERPLIFALSNPTSLSECTAQEAYRNTHGRCIFASGSPFPPVLYKGRRYLTGQANSYYIFPGVALGVIAANACNVTDAMFLIAAKTLASNVREEDIRVGRIYPHVNSINAISQSIAANVLQYACEHNFPEKNQITIFLRRTVDLNEWMAKHLYPFFKTFSKLKSMHNIIIARKLEMSKDRGYLPKDLLE